VLEQFDALKLYFRSEVTDNNSTGADEIYEKLMDPLNKLYNNIEFFEYILPIFNNLNLNFKPKAQK
jgi:isoleucyl-tRNA synthetase